MPHYQAYHRPDDRDQEAPEINAGRTGSSDRTEDPAANHRPDDAEEDVKRECLVAFYFASLLAMKPAMSPNTIQPITPITMLVLLPQRSRGA